MLEDTVHRVTGKSDSSHTRMKRNDEPQSELRQFCGIPEMGHVTGVTDRCDFGHTALACTFLIGSTPVSPRCVRRQRTLVVDLKSQTSSKRRFDSVQSAVRDRT